LAAARQDIAIGVLLTNGVDAMVSLCGHHAASTTEAVERALRVSPEELIRQYRGNADRLDVRLRPDSQSDSTRMHVKITVPGAGHGSRAARDPAAAGLDPP
jgi:hypothetical protein